LEFRRVLFRSHFTTSFVTSSQRGRGGSQVHGYSYRSRLGEIMATALQQIPDGIEVVETSNQATLNHIPPLLIIDNVIAFLYSHVLVSSPLSWKRIGEGQSNVTYLLERDVERFVLRLDTRSTLPKSTHDMMREAKNQQLVGTQGVPIPEILAVCSDESVLGVPFYVMNYLEGEVITDDFPGQLASAQN